MILRTLVTLVFVLFTTWASAQVFHNKEKIYTAEQDYVLVPAIHFSYELVNDNKPEILLGVQLLADGYMIGMHYGAVQKTLMIGGGLVIPLSTKSKRKKKTYYSARRVR